MQLELDSDAVQEALRVVARLAPPVTGNVTIKSDGKKVFMNSNSETSRCEVNIPSSVSGKPNSFAISLNSLRDATKGRKKLSVTYAKTMCVIKSGAYKSELATVDSMEIEATEEEKIGKPVKMTADQATWLKGAVATVALRPTDLVTTFMPLAIKLTDKGAFVACYDNNHMAFINSSEITGDMETTLPIDMFLAVLDAFGKSDFKMELSKANLYVSNKLIKVVLALPEENPNALKINEVIAGAKDTKGAKGEEVEVSKEEFLGYMDNARAIATKERSELKINLEQGKMRLSVTTTQGTAKAIIKASANKALSAPVDFNFIDEAVRKCGDSVVMKFVKDAFIAVKLAKGTIVLSLNQES